MLNLISKLRKICWNPVNLNINLVQNLNIRLKRLCQIWTNLPHKSCPFLQNLCQNCRYILFTKLYLNEIDLTPVETVKKSGEKQSEPKSSHRAAPHFFAHFSRISISESFSFLPSFLSQDFLSHRISFFSQSFLYLSHRTSIKS